MGASKSSVGRHLFLPASRWPSFQRGFRHGISHREPLVRSPNGVCAQVNVWEKTMGTTMGQQWDLSPMALSLALLSGKVCRRRLDGPLVALLIEQLRRLLSAGRGSCCPGGNLWSGTFARQCDVDDDRPHGLISIQFNLPQGPPKVPAFRAVAPFASDKAPPVEEVFELLFNPNDRSDFLPPNLRKLRQLDQSNLSQLSQTLAACIRLE